MSDEDREIDIDSDEADYDDDDESSYSGSTGAGTSRLQNPNMQFMTAAQRRAHHNALERKRRDHIKDSFECLRDAVPTIKGEKISRAQILKSATEYIQFMKRKNGAVQSDITDLKKQNGSLEQQIRALERARTTGQFASDQTALTLLDDCMPDESTDMFTSTKKQRTT